MKTVISRDPSEAARSVARSIAEFIVQNPGSLMCFAAGDTPLSAFAELIKLQDSGEVDLSSVFYVGLDEWVGLGRETRGSCVQVMFDSFYDPAHIPADHVRVFDGLCVDTEAEKARIVDWIQEHGGKIDFTLLGIGMNGHIGFNEPYAGLPEGCIVIGLDDTTKAVSPKYFDRPLPVERGIGVGAGELKKARKILLMATGAHKADIVRKTVLDAPSPSVPASLLADHPDIAIYLDEAAASSL